MDTAGFFDTHAHLDFPDFAGDVAEVVARAEAAGIGRIVTIGCDFASSERAVALADRFPGVWAAVGWHPCQALSAPEDIRPRLSELARHPKVVAIGETGLDHYRLPSAEAGGSAEDDARMKAAQERIFRQQLEVAAEAGLNVVVHQRHAFEPTLGILREWAPRVRGVFHCFVGTPAEAAAVIALGSRVSFTGIVTFKNGVALRETLRSVPPGTFFFETDSPYLAPVPHRGRRCEPAYVAEVARLAAAERGVSLAQLSAETCAAVREFFPRMG